MTFELFATDWRELWNGAQNHEPVGAIFTKPEIVELILDLAGYTSEGLRLAGRPLLEPSCGDGAFLTVAIRRLIESEARNKKKIDWSDPVLADSVRAADISEESVASARKLVRTLLRSAGASPQRAKLLAQTWVVQTDFLLAEWKFRFDFVIGNPPYVRLEDVPKQVMSRYRDLYATTTDRADLYVAFFERGLQLLSPHGALAFICANRFTKNKYGEGLRKLIVQRYRVRHYVNLEHTQPFLSDVSAYPAIIVIDREVGKPTRAATLENIEVKTLETVRKQALAKKKPSKVISEFAEWYSAGEPWTTTSRTEHARLSKLNRTLPVLEESAPNTKVGIGVATGADRVYVLKAKSPDIEESRQIPMLWPRDVTNQGLNWSGHYLLNPFADEDDGALIDLRKYPGFAAHLERNAAELRGRHVAKSRPVNWYRTIDRVWPRLTAKEKLVIPDIQGASTIGYDKGEYYPHHNLYWITSGSWPLLALKALLRSDMVYKQVQAYSVQMRGGSVRFQAQTLRRVRLPALASLSDSILEELVRVAELPSQEEIDAVACAAFG